MICAIKYRILPYRKGLRGCLLGLLCFLTLPGSAITPTCAEPQQTDNPPAGISTTTILRVGPTRWLRTPSAAAQMARPGDTIEIDAGTYRNDYAEWRQDNLTIRGVGGMAHLQSNGLIPNGKAIWLISGNNTLVENVEFSGARVVDTNGAGIRHEGGNLTLRNTYFHHNEFSVLTGAFPDASLDVFSSRFHFQKRENTFSHGIYVGGLGRFTISGSHFTGTDRGHQIKSRALENHITYNRIEDVEGGTASRLIDLPNCGLSYIIGNDMAQAATTENIDAIGYGAEGCDNRTAQQHRLFVINNTFVNEAFAGALVRNHVAADVLVANNLRFGRGYFLIGEGVTEHNIALNLNARLPGSWEAPAGSAAIDSAIALSLREDGNYLVPTQQFNPPLGTAERPHDNALDTGSREYTGKIATGEVSQ
jgi:parallel beta helix pectate lyase-like protein